MEKYRVYEKIAKTKGHSFFRAENTETRENVVVKKLHHETTWEEILKNKNISLMNNNKIKSIATIREIVKDQQTFYCVFQPLEHNLQAVIRRQLQKEEIFKISRALIQMLLQLNEHKIVSREIRPSSLFISDNLLALKIAHIEAFASRDLTKLELVELQDLRYSCPEAVMTSKDPDQSSMVFGVGLLISELILGRPLLTANTKINYMFELCRLFPEQKLEEAEVPSQSRVASAKQQQKFQNLVGQYDFSNEFIALLREMLRIDNTERIKIGELLQAFDLIVANQQQFIKENKAKQQQAQITIKPNTNQAPINTQILQVEIDLDFQKKPTLSPAINLKLHSTALPVEKNVDDDVAQPIIIKKSSKPFENSNFHSMPVALLKEPIKNSRTTKQQTISTVKRPQLTNYALNEGSNLGVKLGFHPSLFSQNQNDF